MLVAPALAFPVAALGFLTLIALGGQGPLTIHDARGAVTVGAVVAGFVLIVTVRVWFEQSRASSKRVRALGFLLIGVAATPVIAGTIFFEHPHSSKNLAKPSISGCTHPHCLVMAQHGRWTSLGGRVLYDYQWQDCAQTCTDIWRATHRTYLLTDHDLGRRIRLGVSASSGAGIRDFSSNWTYSTETAVVAH